MDGPVVPLPRECRHALTRRRIRLARTRKWVRERKKRLPGLVCEGLGKVRERTWVLVIFQIRIKAAITLRELSISPANDEVLAQTVSRGDTWAKIMRVSVGNDLPGGKRNTRGWSNECAALATNGRIKGV